MRAVRDTVDRLIADVYCGKLHPKIAAGLAPLLQLQLRALGATDGEQRLAKLEQLVARREKSSKTNQSQSRTQFLAGPAPVSAPAAPAPEKQSEHRLAKVEEALPAANRVVEPIYNGAARASEKESKLRLTKVEELLLTQSRQGGSTNNGAAHESRKQSAPRPAKIEERLPAESREAGPAAHDSERGSEPHLARVEKPVPSESKETGPTDPAAVRNFL
jgi:hypothetical protein